MTTHEDWHNHPLEPHSCQYEGGCTVPTLANALEQLKFIPQSNNRDIELATPEAMARIGNYTYQRAELIPAINACIRQGLCPVCPEIMHPIFTQQQQAYQELQTKLNLE